MKILLFILCCITTLGAETLKLSESVAHSMVEQRMKIFKEVLVAKDSSEYVGEDKEVEIGGNLNISIEQDESRNIKGNKSEVVEGTLDIQSVKEYNLSTQSQMNFNAKDNILFFGRKSTSFETQKELSFIADNTDMESKSNLTATAGNQILHQVGDTSITAKGDSVIIKAGGIEVVIDSLKD